MSDLSYINLRNDVVFKYIFGYEKNEKLLIALLNAILGLEGPLRIVKLTFLNAFNIKEYINDKLTSLDVKVKDNTGKRFNVEMQVRGDSDFINKVLFYNDKLFTSQLKQAEPFEKLNKTISIAILNFTLLDYEADLHNIYRFLNIKSKKELTDLKEIHFIELPKFKKNKPRKTLSKFEKWLHILKFGELYTTDLNNIPEALKEEEEIVMVLHEMVRASNDELIREIMEMREKGRHEEASRLYQAERKGREEIIKKFLARGFSIEEISEITDIPLEEVRKIRK